MKQAHALSQACPSGGVMVSAVVHHRLEDLYTFELSAAVANGLASGQAWRLVSAKARATSDARTQP